MTKYFDDHYRGTRGADRASGLAGLVLVAGFLCAILWWGGAW